LPLHIGDDTTGILVKTPAPVQRSLPPPIPGAKPRGKTKARRQARPAKTKAARAPRTRSRVSVAWFLVLLMMGGGGLAGFYLFEQWQTAEEELTDAKRDELTANERAAQADRRALESQAALTRELNQKAKLEQELTGASKRAAKADELATKLQSIVGKQGTVVRENEKLTLEMVDKVLFSSGEAVLTSRGEQVLASVGEELRKFPEKQIWVQGHTDSVPISNELFASNWELSAMRALTVVHYLEEVANVDPRRLAAVGFGEHRPLSRSKKYRNRRIEIVLFPREVRLINE
jgi:chemotaxis protein MotB